MAQSAKKEPKRKTSPDTTNTVSNMNAGNNPGTASEITLPKTWEKLMSEINYVMG